MIKRTEKFKKFCELDGSVSTKTQEKYFKFIEENYVPINGDKKVILEELLNTLFESDEDEDSIEHVDMGYKEFVKKLKQLAK